MALLAIILAILFFKHLAKYAQYNKPVKAPRGSRFVLIFVIVVLLLAVTHGGGGAHR